MWTCPRRLRQQSWSAVCSLADWDEDSQKLYENLRDARGNARDKAQARVSPTRDLARDWHAIIMEGLTVPDRAYVARFRGEEGLEQCEVRIGRHMGIKSSQVADELKKFEDTLQRVTAALDGRIPKGRTPKNRDELNAVLELCAWAHAAWVRIHPFANGNGRTARIWVAFLAMRYGIPPFLRLRPRPGDDYSIACDKAMQGAWEPTAKLFLRLYSEKIGSV